MGATLLALLAGCTTDLGEFNRPWGNGGPTLADGGIAPTPDGGLPPGPAPDGGFLPPADAGVTPDAAVPPDTAPPGIVWKAVLMAGDDSISAFDNARHTVQGLFESRGVLPANMIQLSREASQQTGGVRDTSVENFAAAMNELAIGPNDGCLIHMTSHGNQQGFYITGRDNLSPTDLDQILDDACGDRPTVVLISACYSGVFIPPSEAPNRIILTAASADRSSFGCGTEDEYTYWDGCLIDNFPTATTWAALYDSVTTCIERKESGGFTPSQPQGSFGSSVADLPIL